MTPETIVLGQLVKDWIEADPVLNDHFLVNIFPKFALDITKWENEYTIQYACPNRSTTWTVILINQRAVESWMTAERVVVEDPRFFIKLRKMLYIDHDKTTCRLNNHRRRSPFYCKELLND